MDKNLSLTSNDVSFIIEAIEEVSPLLLSATTDTQKVDAFFSAKHKLEAGEVSFSGYEISAILTAAEMLQIQLRQTLSLSKRGTALHRQNEKLIKQSVKTVSKLRKIHNMNS